MLVPSNSKFVLETLDKLAAALAEKGHIWTPEERRDYERSVVLLKRMGAE